MSEEDCLHVFASDELEIIEWTTANGIQDCPLLPILSEADCVKMDMAGKVLYIAGTYNDNVWAVIEAWVAGGGTVEAPESECGDGLPVDDGLYCTLSKHSGMRLLSLASDTLPSADEWL